MKISIIGGGFVGATAAFVIAERELGDVVIVDILESVKGKALDMHEAVPNISSDAGITGTTEYRDIRGSDIVVITAGLPRKPGMTREDLLGKNRDIVSAASENVRKYAPDSIVIVVTNPLDVMAYQAFRTTGFASNRVMGMAGVLDSARFRRFIADELKVSARDVCAMVLGSHGDSMVPLPEYTTVGGIPVTQLIKEERLAEIIKRTRNAGGEIVKYLGTGSAYYAPATSILEMVEAIVKDKGRMIPASAYLQGEYGIDGVYIGVPIILGKNGVEKIVELKLGTASAEALRKSADIVRENIGLLENEGSDS
ncbi:MAG: malate dehydrogenase [archaeon]